jgi:invasion protein IalB
MITTARAACSHNTIGLLRSLVPAAILLVAVWVGTQNAAAQGAVKSVYGDWQVRCESPSGGQENQCALVQSVTAEDRPDVGLTIVVVKNADHKSPVLRVVAPMGVMLPSGLGLKIDEVDVGRVGFVRCLPNGCVAEVVMDADLLEKLRGGQTATFIIFLAPEKGLGFPINLNGFGEGVDGLS